MLQEYRARILLYITHVSFTSRATAQSDRMCVVIKKMIAKHDAVQKRADECWTQEMLDGCMNAFEYIRGLMIEMSMQRVWVNDVQPAPP